MSRDALACVPALLYADARGNIREHPYLRMSASRGETIFEPELADLIPLPEESEIFLLPKRKAVGFNPRSGKFETAKGNAVAAFAAPGFTLSAHPGSEVLPDAPVLPLFAYGAVGYAKGRYWICARQVDREPRQQFSAIPHGRIEKNCRQLLRSYPVNRMVEHIISNCALRYCCPAARNFALGRYEAPLPTSRTCNARCLGCISQPHNGGPVETTPQCRLEFTPSPEEIAEVMSIHAARAKHPIYSFGQGCEGDPLMNWHLLCEATALFRASGGKGTVNCNTNGSRPEAVRNLAQAGLTSMRISLNSARKEIYDLWYRPAGYSFDNVLETLKEARKHGIFTSLNFLWFPSLSDTFEELEALTGLCREAGVGMIQWRNLNIDPHWLNNYVSSRTQAKFNLCPGLAYFMAELKKNCPWLRYGYFNPWLGERAEITAP